MRILKSIIIFLVLIAVVLGAFYVFYMQPRYVTPILMYHSVSKDPESTLSVTPHNFERQMEYLARAGYKVISLGEFVEAKKNKTIIPRKTVVITFDDGFEDNFLYAFPVLSKYDMPAVIFLMTGYMGRVDGYLNWDQVRLMIENDIDFGGHTRTGAYLPSVENEEDLRKEIVGCKGDIEKETGKEVKYFCYPIGGFNDQVKKIVKDAGYDAACTTNRGYDKYNKDLYELNRVKITDSDINKPLHFRAKLSGYYNLFRRGKSGS